ncbi:MAG: hypothetical protein PHE84_01055 [bacterium]|nr:hypothetical protein [bacterium]
MTFAMAFRKSSRALIFCPSISRITWAWPSPASPATEPDSTNETNTPSRASTRY